MVDSRPTVLASSRVHQNSVPSTQMQSRIKAILQATARSSAATWETTCRRTSANLVTKLLNAGCPWANSSARRIRASLWPAPKMRPKVFNMPRIWPSKSARIKTNRWRTASIALCSCDVSCFVCTSRNHPIRNILARPRASLRSDFVGRMDRAAWACLASIHTTGEPRDHPPHLEGHPTSAGEVSCRDCERISQAPAPFHVIPRGWAAPNLLAMILFEKFGEHQPLNCQAERYCREGAFREFSMAITPISTTSFN